MKGRGTQWSLFDYDLPSNVQTQNRALAGYHTIDEVSVDDHSINGTSLVVSRQVMLPPMETVLVHVLGVTDERGKEILFSEGLEKGPMNIWCIAGSKEHLYKSALMQLTENLGDNKIREKYNDVIMQICDKEYFLK